MPKRVEVGVVTGDKMNKTRRVEIPRLVKHPKYGKYLRRRTVCYVHDEDNQSRAGDTVEIIESRPMSRKKRWQLVRVVSKSRLAGMAVVPEGEPLEPAQEGLGVEGLGIGDEGRGTKDEGLGIGD